MKLRKKQMKLRKNEIISPKSFSAPHRIIRDTYQGIYDFLHREVDEVTIYNVSAMDWLLARAIGAIGAIRAIRAFGVPTANSQQLTLASLQIFEYLCINTV